MRPSTPALTSSSTLRARLRAVARQYEDRPAVIDEGVTVSYQQLFARAEAFASKITDGGNSDLGPVGLVFPRGESFIAAVIGCVLANTAYVPLDPRTPREYRERIFRLARVKLVIEDDQWRRLSEEGATPAREEFVDDAAYVLFTSGSTGMPKGVAVGPESIVNLVNGARTLFGYDENDRWSFCHSPGFDYSVWELFGPLLTGGSCVVFSDADVRDPAAVLKRIEATGVTLLSQTPTAFKALDAWRRSSSEHVDLSSLAWVVFGGEALMPAMLREFAADYPKVQLVNMYGITETTVHTTYHVLTPDDLESGHSIIGVPLPGVRVYLADEKLGEVPDGTVGEIMVGGEGVALGYLGDPERTMAAFVTGPSGADGRVYRSGDLAYRMPTGELVFVGRGDRQVKIRGHRVELGQVEAGLREAMGGGDVRVCAASSQGEAHLVAFVQRSSQNETTGSLDRLGASLPEYMVPSAVIEVDTWPSTANGKTDDAALLSLFERQREAEAATPRSKSSDVVLEAFAEFLERPTQEIDEQCSFFAQGGDSIRALRTVLFLNTQLDSELTVGEFYLHDSVAALREHLSKQAETAQDQGEPRCSAVDVQAKGAIDRFRDKLPQYDARFGTEFELSRTYPLTPIERGMIFSSKLRPELPVYYDQMAIGLQIDSPDAFVAAMELLIRRHEVLRSRYFSDTGHLGVRWLDTTGPGIEIHPLDGLTDQEATRAIKSLQDRRAESRLDFDGEFLWSMDVLVRRPSIVPGTDANAVIVFCFHHAMLDGWSVAVLFAELSQLLGGEEPLPPVTQDYGAYAEYVLGNDRSASLEFWRTYVDGAERGAVPFNVAEIPRCEHAPARTIVRRLDPTLDGRIRVASARWGVSEKAVCLSAHVMTVSLLSGGSPGMTGVVCQDRPMIDGADRILGCFLTTLPLRYEGVSSMSVVKLVEMVDDFLRRIADHTLSLAELAQLDVSPAGRNPFFDTLFNYIDFHVLGDRRNTSDEALGDLLVGQEMTNTFFDLEQIRTPTGSFAKLKFVPDLIDEEEAQTALRVYQRALELITTSSDARVLSGDVVLDEGVRGDGGLRAIVEGPMGIVPTEHDPVGHLLQLAERHPDRVAASDESRSLTYGRLAEDLIRVAAGLAQRGVVRGDRVGFSMGRTVDVLPMALGVLALGASFVPIDESWPRERASYVLEDAGCVLCVSDLRDRGNAVAFEELLAGLDGDAVASVRNGLRPFRREDEMYAIYTSGSTGKPKGVAIEHGSLLNLLGDLSVRSELSPDDVLLCLSAFAFDLSVFDLFGALHVGGRVVICPSSTLGDFDGFVQLLQRHQVSIWNSVPSTFNWLVDACLASGHPLSLPDLRLVMLSGDWVSTSHVRAARDLLPRARVVALGGATECTVWSNWYDTVRLPPLRSTVPYGRPLTNTFFAVVDDRLNILPRGVPGELVIGGGGVGRGYIGLSDTTKHAFIETLPGGPPGRVYRTGDLGRILPDGNIEFLGRNDAQVKVRGYRIELSEIEAASLTMPGVRQCVVKVVGTAEKSLCAYLVADTAVTLEALRKHLGATLPVYMLPSACVLLEVVPLTQNGKVDRKALPPPPTAESPAKVRNTATPTTAWERLVLETLAELRPDLDPDLDANLFAVGLRSLDILALAGRIKEGTGRAVTLRELFLASSVRDMVRAIEGASETPARKEAENQEGGWPSSHAQQRLWALQEMSGGQSTAYNVVEALEIEHGGIELEALVRAVDRVVEEQPSLRSVFDYVDGVLWTRPMSAKQRRWSWSTRSVEADEIDALLEKERATPFDLRRGPVLRVQYLERGSHRGVLVLATHHIVFDGWSAGVFLASLLDHYRAELPGEGRTVEASPRPTVVAVDPERAFLDSAEETKARAYWRGFVREVDPCPLVSDRHAEDRDSGGAAASSVTLSLDLHAFDRVRSLCSSRALSLFSVLATTSGVALARFTAQGRICLGTPVSTRGDAQRGTIGFFVNTLPIAIRPDQAESFVDLARAVKEQLADSLEHRLFPLDMIVAEAKEQAGLRAEELFAAELVVLEQGELTGRELALELGWSMQARDVEAAHAKFPVSVQFRCSEVLKLKLEFDTRLFERTTIEAIGRHVLDTLWDFIERPDASIELPRSSAYPRPDVQLSVLRGEEVPKRDSVPLDRIRRAAQHDPNAVALEGPASRLTWSELVERIDKLAGSLRAAGVSRGEKVIVFTDRSVEAIVHALGVMAAGGVYVPVAGDENDDRITRCIERVGARIGLGESAIVGHRLASLKAVEGDRPAPRLDSVITRDAPAYVIFTSGSSGEPKAVEVSHGALDNLVSWMGRRFGFGVEDVFLQRSPFTFDASVWEFVVPLCCGSRVVVATHTESFVPEQLLDAVERHGVTVLPTVPSVLRPCLDFAARAGSKHLPAGLRYVFAAGEVLHPATVELHRSLSGAVLVNMYGPTETTIQVTAHECSARDEDRTRLVPLGQPTDGVDIWIVDTSLRPVPRGAVGQIAVSGLALADGYIGEVELTRERFPVVSLDDRDVRLYLTGDLGRIDSRGVLVFLGRMDRQVKLAGVRVELGEVESAMSRVPGSTEAFAAIESDDQGREVIVGYVAMSAMSSASEIRRELQELLPHRYQPDRIVVVERLPRLASGKLDLRALQQLAASEVEENLRMPSEDMEVPVTVDVVRRVWRRVLGHGTFTDNEDFFTAGGNSMKLLRVHELISERFATHVDIVAILQQPTVVGMAATIHETSSASEAVRGIEL